MSSWWKSVRCAPILYLICKSHHLPSAEFMLDVIGAGATATSAENWHEIWNASKHSLQLQQELDAIHSEGRNRPPVKATFHSEFAASWIYQTIQLSKRDAAAHWRDPTYLVAKLALNSVGGLFTGFTFFKSKDSQQGTQNKLFVRALVFFSLHSLLTRGDFSGYFHGNYPQVPFLILDLPAWTLTLCGTMKLSSCQPVTSPLYCHEDNLRNSRAPKSYVQLDSPSYVPNIGCVALECPWIHVILPLLVLDCWFWIVESWVYLPHARCHIPYIFHNSRTGMSYFISWDTVLTFSKGRSIDGTISWDGSHSLFIFVLFCHRIVSILLYDPRRMSDSGLSNGVLQPFRALGWWQWMWAYKMYERCHMLTVISQESSFSLYLFHRRRIGSRSVTVIGHVHGIYEVYL